MPSLSDIQAGFARAVLDARHAVPAGLRSSRRARPLKRFNVYRNNVYSSLIDVLQAAFPIIDRLVGSEFFRATARVFVEKHPPVSPVVMRYGAAFPDFLDAFEPVADLPYLGDVARLEWARTEAYHAADATPASAEALQRVPPEQAELLILGLHPSVRLVRSRYPVVTIWTANCQETPPLPIDAGAGGEDALVLRPGLNVEVRRLPPGGAEFIGALSRGHTLGEAAAAGAEAAGEFDLQDNLVGLIRSGAIGSLHLEDRARMRPQERNGEPSDDHVRDA